MSLLNPMERTRSGEALQAELKGVGMAQSETLLGSAWRDFVYAEVWSRPGLDRRSRFFISLAGSAYEGCAPEVIDSYVRGALTSDEITLAELRETALHLAVYAGWSRGMVLDVAISRVADELGLPPAQIEPLRSAPWDPEQRLKEGAANFTEVMVMPAPPPVTPYFEGGILNLVFGEMWMRPGLDQRARRWVTMVSVANSASSMPIRSHTYAAMASGNASVEEMQEFVLQYALHGGWPKASVMQGVVFEMSKRVAEGLPFEA